MENVARSGGAIPPPPPGLPTYSGQAGLIPLGRIIDRGGERVVGVPVAGTFFAYMAGRSRYGKTETAIGQFIALTRSGHGGLFLDPHADAIKDIKPYLTDPGIRERVVEINLADTEHDGQAPAWNLFALERRTPAEAAGKVEAFVDALAAAMRWDERNTRALNLATQSAQALIELALALPPELAPTIFQVPTLLSDDEWRAAILPALSVGTRGFFQDRFPRLPAEAITAVTNLIDRLRAARPVAAFLGSPLSTYDARRAMRDGLVVLACPGSGSTRDRLVANLLVYDVLHAAKARANIEKGLRNTVIITLLDTLLREHRDRTSRSGSDLVFGRDADTPFNPNTAYNRARKAWTAARQREDEEGIIPEHERLRPIGLHECRHTAVSHMLDAGITIDKVSKFIGHSSITVTIDRYGHLLPGGEAEAAALLDEYHTRRRQEASRRQQRREPAMV